MRFEPIDGLLNRATWTPAGDYHVYAWWRASAEYTHEASFTAFHDGGSTTVVKNHDDPSSEFFAHPRRG